MNTAVLAEPRSKTRSWRHQIDAFNFCLDKEAAMLAMEMGCGKTKVAIDLCCAKRAKTVLVSCPLSVCGVWPREFGLHSIEPYDVVGMDKGSVRTKTEEAYQALRIAQAKGRRCAIVVNHESLWREPFASFALNTEWDMVIVDESHRAKQHDGKFASFLGGGNKQNPRCLRHAARSRLTLTGTPMPHSPLDIFSQYRFLDPGTLGLHYFPFRKTYAVMGGFENKEVVGFKNTEELNRKVYSLMFRVLKKDALDLPEEIDEVRKCELPPSALKIYDEMEGRLYAEVDEGKVTAANALVKLLRLQQITSGFIRTDDDTVADLHDAKKKLLAEVIEDATKPVVVFCRFVHDLHVVASVARDLDLYYAEVSGRRKDLAHDGTMEQSTDILGVQIQAGGVGVDLSRASTGIYYSCGFNLGDYLQSRSRLHRPGQRNNVTFIHLVVPRSIDTRVYGALRRRENVIESVLQRRAELGSEE